jgi:hypothetical protein
MTLKSSTALAFAFAAAAAGLCLMPAPSHATAGAEPWCLNDDEGNSHCNYASSQACLAAVSGGSRGFCNVNSSGASTPVAPPQRRRGRSPDR